MLEGCPLTLPHHSIMWGRIWTILVLKTSVYSHFYGENYSTKVHQNSQQLSNCKIYHFSRNSVNRIAWLCKLQSSIIVPILKTILKDFFQLARFVAFLGIFPKPEKNMVPSKMFVHEMKEKMANYVWWGVGSERLNNCRAKTCKILFTLLIGHRRGNLDHATDWGWSPSCDSSQLNLRQVSVLEMKTQMSHYSTTLYLTMLSGYCILP